jgi:DNA-binding HxlR family transcriptional regulator
VAPQCCCRVEQIPFAELRASCRVHAKTLYQRLAAVTAAGIVTKSANGYRLTAR